MGGLFSKKSKPDSFEKALSDIEKKIRKAELRLFDLKVRQRRVKVAFIWYSLTVYAISLLLILTYARPNTENTRDVVSKVVPLICGPVVIYYTLHLITLYYERSHRNQEAEIDNLKAKKKLKIEELKEQTAYYLTKGLLERYESGENSMNEPPNEQLRQLESMQNENAHGPPPNGPPLPNGIPGPISPTSPTPGQFYEGPGMPPFRSPSDLHTQHTSASDLMSLPSPSNVPQGWFDKLIDKLLGDDGSEANQKYALICSQCHRHNGLVRPDDIEDTHFFCRYCNYHNEPHRKSQLKLQSQNLSQSLPSLPSDISLSASGGLQERKENLEAKQYSKSVDSLAEKSANLHGKISPQTKPKAKAPSPQKPSNAIPPEPSSSSSIESSSQRSSTSSSSVPTAVSSAIPNNTETLRKRNPGKNDNAAHDTPSTDETDSLKTDQSPLSSKQSSPSKPSNPSSSPDPAFSVSDSSSVKDTSPKSAEESKSSAPATPKRSRKKSKGSRKSKNRKEAVGSEIASEQSEVGESTGDDEIS